MGRPLGVALKGWFFMAFHRFLLACILAAIVMVPSSWAWEFRLRGEAEWRYRHISRTGPGDLFGNAEVAQKSNNTSTSIGFAGPQLQAVRLEGYSSKGSNAAYGEQRFWLYPEIRINRALRVRSIVTFQGNVNANYGGGGANWVTNPHYSGWIMIDSRDLFAGTGLAVPALRALWLTARTPLGILTVGRRPAAFGMGWVVHEDDSYARSISIIAPYGPLLFAFSQYFHGNSEYTDPNDDRNARIGGRTIASAVDQNEAYNFNSAFAAIYSAGSFEIGAMVYVIARYGQHSVPQPGGTYQDDVSGSGAVLMVTNFPGWAWNTTNQPMYVGDMQFYTGVTYLKYNNGRFFWNSEFDCLKLDMSRHGGRPITGFATAWAAETGVLAGPVKLSLAHFYRSGHDRRGGLFNVGAPTGRFDYPLADRLGFVNVYTADRFDKFIGIFLGGGDSPVKPYATLLGIYGAGGNSYTSTGSCAYEDFNGWAARLDYAAAANLNLFGSFMLARRASNTATPQGYYIGTWGPPNPALAANPWLVQANRAGSGTLMAHPMFPVTQSVIPNVPDNDLGWEVNAGCAWKLLEGMTLNLKFAYWQPGEWFKWAYRDMTISDPANYLFPNNTFTFLGSPPPGIVNPARSIDAITMWEGSLLAEF